MLPRIYLPCQVIILLNSAKGLPGLLEQTTAPYILRNKYELAQATVSDLTESHLNNLIQKARVANVAGTAEPIYGPSALESVAKQAEKTPYTELTKDDLKWTAMESTCVETQVFYLMAESGHIASVQVIYSNIA